VFSIDYRGYGDSTGCPNETGLVKDIITLYDYIRLNKKSKSNIYLWGHSLGTGVMCHVGKLLSKTECNNEKKRSIFIDI
jgi:abhydrolase domain-containing protein 12